MSEENPEIGQSVDVDGIATNYHRLVQVTLSS
jgi:hypothetical protein